MDFGGWLGRRLRRGGSRQTLELGGHLQAANLGKRSADVPVEQERERRERSHLVLKDGDVSVSSVLHDEGKGLGLVIPAEAAIRMPRSPPVTPSDGREVRRHLGGQHARSLTVIRLFPFRISAPCRRTRTVRASTPPRPHPDTDPAQVRGHHRPTHCSGGRVDDPAPRPSHSRSSRERIPRQGSGSDSGASRQLRSGIASPSPHGSWARRAPSAARPVGPGPSPGGSQDSPRVPTAPVSDSPSTSMYTSACGHTA